MSLDEAPMEITPATLFELWREIALYLEIWDLIGTASPSRDTALRHA